jgi:sugar phosphate isomerase/epimerase
MSAQVLGRRQFFQLATAAASVAASATEGAAAPTVASDPLPKLTMITRYSPQRVRFAASAGYESVELVRDDVFTPEKLNDTQIEAVLANVRNAGIRLLSIECGWINHIDKDPQRRRQNVQTFIRCLELGHRLGCNFVGTLSGGMPGSPLDDQIKAFCDVVNEHYVPVCEKLNLRMGWENYPDPENFATVPATWEKILANIPSRRVGLEFDPSHLVRQFIDPVKAAWDFRQRIYGFHAKDTEIIQPVLQKVGISGKDWWRYRIPGQGIVDWPKMFNVLLEAHYDGCVSVEHEDPFFDEPKGDDFDVMAASRKRGFVLAATFLRQYLPATIKPS